MLRASQLERAEMRFRQMCCLALGGRMVVPSLFVELQRVVPFSTCLYMGLGPAGPVDVYFNANEVGQTLPLYAQAYFNRAERSVWATPDEAARAEVGPQLLAQVLRISTTAYYRHAIYNEIFRPCNVHTFIRMLIRDHGRVAHTFSIGRGPRDTEFGSAEAEVISRLEPYITHALAQPKDIDGADLVDGESALIVVDVNGEIESLSERAGQLLQQCQGNPLTPPTLPAGLRGAVRSLTDVALGRSNAGLPLWSDMTAWGLFIARAYWLQTHGAMSTRIGIHLQRRVPRSLVMMQRLFGLRLPPQQEQVALLLATGRSESQAAGELGLSRNTVIYHRRQIYNRLEVDSRAALVDFLSEPARTL